LQAAAKSNNQLNRLDLFLAERSAEMLLQLGEKSYLTKMDDLAVFTQAGR
jgi:hypothetical protein